MKKGLIKTLSSNIKSLLEDSSKVLLTVHEERRKFKPNPSRPNKWFCSSATKTLIVYFCDIVYFSVIRKKWT